MLFLLLTSSTLLVLGIVKPVCLCSRLIAAFLLFLHKPLYWEWAFAHTTCSCDGGQGCRYGGHNYFQDYFPDTFSFHCFFILLVNLYNSQPLAIVSSASVIELSCKAIALMSLGHSFSVSLSFPPNPVSLHTTLM